MDIKRICGDIPIVMVGNKVDVKDRKVKRDQIIYPKKKQFGYYDVSAKINHQFEKPFIWLLGKLLEDPNLHLVEEPALKPKEIQLNSEDIEEIEKDAEEAANMGLPESDADES